MLIRLRKKSTIFIAVVIVFFCFYFYSKIQENCDRNQIFYLEEKFKEIEGGLGRNHEQIAEILKKVEFVDSSSISFLKFKNVSSDQSCNVNVNVVPSPDIQMLKAYREIPFDNIEGGAWTQGWKIEYDTHDWNQRKKLKVFVVPHSHNDPGWKWTFDEYYEGATRYIFNNMLQQLDENKNMKFIWAEIVFFSRWYDNLPLRFRDKIKTFVERKQLEFVTGGWVMPDEACSHWYSVLQSLTEGQKYLKQAFNVTPISSWAIDPFGHSATFAYILKKSGFENLLIQRTHYSVKKYLAQRKQLEFRWTQLWDGKGDTELFTHMMPFYSYDIRRSCGPDPNICGQFDFRKKQSWTWPWEYKPQPITDDNIARKADLLVDQWRKKSKLFKTKSLLVPHGDDFRYATPFEWEDQRINLEKLFNYINKRKGFNVEAKFATLQEYFDSVKKEKELQQFPSLSGDFFTYADRDDHYWSGYFTSRPYYKRMDRILMNYLRSAEMLHSWNAWEDSAGFDKKLEVARRALSIFQHHDGVSGTAKDYVMKDYDSMMTEGIRNCKFVMQQAVYRLLTQSNIYQPDYSFVYFNVDDSRSAGNDDSRSVIIIGEEVQFKFIVVHNSLPRERHELVEFYIAKPFVSVTDPEGNAITAQVSPVWTWKRNVFNYFLVSLSGSFEPKISTTKYKLSFMVKIPPLGLSVYKINQKRNRNECAKTSYAEVSIFTDSHFNINEFKKKYPGEINFEDRCKNYLQHDDENFGATFHENGLLESLVFDDEKIPVSLKFLRYGTKSSHGEKSGAYLFLPDGPATPFKVGKPTVIVTKGELQQDLTAGLPFAVHENILRKGESLEIRNYVDIGDMGNTEIVMRLSTNIKSNQTFFTDLNGMQMVKRERFSKIPLQANYYPIPSAMFIEDKIWRLTIFSGLPLGGSSLKSGEIEIMQDRRMNQGDGRGLGQGVQDNQPVLNIFKLVLENRESCQQLDENYPTGFLTPNSYREQKILLHLIEKFIFNENDWNGVIYQFGENHESAEAGIELVALRVLPAIPKSPLGVVLHRANFGECSPNNNNDGFLNLRQLFGSKMKGKIYNSHITLLEKQQRVNDTISLCPMDLTGFIIDRK